MCILTGKSLALFLNSFLLLQSFWVKNAKKTAFLRKNGFELSFLKKYAVTNWSTRPEKKTKQLKCCLW